MSVQFVSPVWVCAVVCSTYLNGNEPALSIIWPSDNVGVSVEPVLSNVATLVDESDNIGVSVSLTSVLAVAESVNVTVSDEPVLSNFSTLVDDSYNIVVSE